MSFNSDERLSVIAELKISSAVNAEELPQKLTYGFSHLLQQRRNVLS